MLWPTGTTQADIQKRTGAPWAVVASWAKYGEIPDGVAGEFGLTATPVAEAPPLPAVAPAVKPVGVASRWTVAVVGLMLAMNVAYLAGYRLPGTGDVHSPVIVVESNQQAARSAGLRYLDLCCTEVIDKLDAANDGDLKATEALHIIQVSIPIIQKQTWSPLTDRLSQLQDDSGKMDQAKLKQALAEVRKGLKSCR